MMARRVFLGILPLWVLAAALAVTWLPETFSTWEKAVRLALCAPLILYLPGRMLVDTLRIEGDMVTRGTLSVFLSFAACIFCGLLLHVVGHLDARGWVYALGLTTFAVRWLNVVLQLARPVPAIPWAWPGRRFLTFAASMILATSSVLVARPVALERKPFHFTELWMVPKWNWTNNVVTVGVRNSEDVKTVYSLDLVLGGTLIGKMPTFELAPSSSQTFEFSVPTRTRPPARLEAWLFKGGDRGTIYRKVWMTIDPLQSPASTGISLQFADPEMKNG
ncbi:hypothetical protein [Rhizobium ruizarguesonis]|uniref:hypothetical protein n=1 Tax=Rhizobium ruizarguesonis TaxID=2081791 RepID=UPI001447F0F8|nr:hypothetical protein [Rhizobium ruizarguesonis]NKQ83879.1 hypothetical protein [Rhizobium ruizarguesonis]